MWVVVALCSLAALTALVLCIPVDLDLRLEVYGKATLHLRFGWLFGRVRKTFRTGEGRKVPARPKAEKAPARPKPEKEAGKPRGVAATGRLLWRLVRVRGLVESVARLSGRLLHCFSLRRLYLDFRAGLEDPADTALLLGPMCLKAMFADLWTRDSIRLVPAFEGEPFLEGQGGIGIRLYPIRTVPPLLAFLFNPSTLKTLIVVVRWKWRKGQN